MHLSHMIESPDESCDESNDAYMIMSPEESPEKFPSGKEKEKRERERTRCNLKRALAGS